MAAKAGDAPSAYALATLCCDGLGITKSAEIAFAWFEVAAEKGYGPAQYEVGVMCEKGSGTTANSAIAKEWYQKAAKQGNAEAIAALKRLDGK
jgi:TPR repeat protein